MAKKIWHQQRHQRLKAAWRQAWRNGSGENISNDQRRKRASVNSVAAKYHQHGMADGGGIVNISVILSTAAASW